MTTIWRVPTTLIVAALTSPCPQPVIVAIHTVAVSFVLAVLVLATLGLPQAMALIQRGAGRSAPGRMRS